MSFKDVVRKNFIGNVKQYLSFFLCNTFTIVIFFIYSTLIFNEGLMSGESQDVFQYVLPVTVVGITVFSIFFLLYASASFVKGRNKELGVYLSLGMTKKQLKKLVNMENAIINGVSLAAGILIGALTARLFQLAILKIMEIDDVSFYMDYKSFLLTFAMFLAIFIVINVRTSIRMGQQDINAYLKEDHKREAVPFKKKDAILGSIGGAGMILSIIVLKIITSKEELTQNMPVVFGYLFVLFGAIYLTISKGGRWVLEKIKSTRYYRDNMVFLAEVLRKYNQNKRILFVLSVLSTLTILFLASPISLLSLSEEIATMNHNSVEYVETVKDNKIEKETLDTILNQEELVSYKEVPFLYLYRSEKQEQIEEAIPIISVEEFNRQMQSNMSIPEGECVSFVIDWVPGSNGVEPGKEISLYGDNKSYSFQVSKASHDEFFAGMSFPSATVLVVNAKEYDALYEENKINTGAIYHLMQYKDWKKTGDIISKLEGYVTNKNFSILSVLNTYETLKKGYSTFLFVSIVVAILFFVAGGAVLYFRQMAELGQTKEMFAKINKIGITKKETKKIIKKELLLIYFVPVVFGAFAGISLIQYCTKLFGGADVLTKFMQTSIKVIIVYMCSQLLFYLITKVKYYKELLS